MNSEDDKDSYKPYISKKLIELGEEMEEQGKEFNAKLDKLSQQKAEAFLNDPTAQKLVQIGKNIRGLKDKLEGGFRNLLLAHAGGAVLVINLGAVPDNFY